MARLSTIIGNESIQESDVIPVLDASGLFGPVENAVFALEQTLDRDGLLDLVLSRSYLAKLPPPEREPVLDAVGALYDETATPEGVRLAYVTRVLPRLGDDQAETSTRISSTRPPIRRSCCRSGSAGRAR